MISACFCSIDSFCAILSFVKTSLSSVFIVLTLLSPYRHSVQNDCTPKNSKSKYMSFYEYIIFNNEHIAVLWAKRTSVFLLYYVRFSAPASVAGHRFNSVYPHLRQTSSFTELVSPHTAQHTLCALSFGKTTICLVP